VNHFYDDHDPLENIDPSLVVSTQDDDFDIVSISTGEEDDSQVKTRLNTEYMQEAQQSGVTYWRQHNQPDLDHPVFQKL
jgi:cell division protein ZipA